MDEAELQTTIAQYEAQLSQVELALSSQPAAENADLLELKSDLEEVIALTKESLLSYKKAALLQQLEENTVTDAQQDDEYTKFQAAIADNADKTQTAESVTGTSDSDAAPSGSIGDLSDVIGTCVRAPFTHSWGKYQYHNAAIIDLDPDNQKVVVMFCQPTHASMKICPYFLDGDRCRRGEDECDLSHGHSVHIDDLREYEPADNSFLSVGDVCLARFPSDDLWYKATIVDTHDGDLLQVMYDDYGEATHALERSDVIPYHSQSGDSSGSESDDDEALDSQPSSSRVEPSCRPGESDDVPTYLWKPSGSEDVAQWETHTKGVGSRLMAAMGYQSGQGLGKDGQGRVEPVPILKLPPGKSLDQIMQLKARTGNTDMFDVLKKKKSKRKSSATSGRPRQKDIFSYINQTLSHGNKVQLTTFRDNRGGRGGRSQSAGADPAVISRHQMKKKSDRSINVQVIKTDNEIAKVEQEILGIRQRLEVNKSRKDAGAVSHLLVKLGKAESYLETLRKSHRELTRHQSQRQGRKKLTVF